MFLKLLIVYNCCSHSSFTSSLIFTKKGMWKRCANGCMRFTPHSLFQMQWVLPICHTHSLLSCCCSYGFFALSLFDWLVWMRMSCTKLTTTFRIIWTRKISSKMWVILPSLHVLECYLDSSFWKNSTIAFSDLNHSCCNRYSGVPKRLLVDSFECN